MDDIKLIEDVLDSYKRIFLLDVPSVECASLLKIAEKTLDGRSVNDVLFLVRYCDEYSALNVRIVNDNEYETALRLYGMYEFSDRFRIIGGGRHGSLLELRKSGLLTDEELGAALFM